jgi:hypothetical protein
MALPYRLVLHYADGTKEVRAPFELDSLAKTGDLITIEGHPWIVNELHWSREELTLDCVPRD